MIKLPGFPWQLRTASGDMGKTLFSDSMMLNYALVAFLVALPTMVLLYKWVI
jgi:hypothetical protein